MASDSVRVPNGIWDSILSELAILARRDPSCKACVAADAQEPTRARVAALLAEITGAEIEGRLGPAEAGAAKGSSLDALARAFIGALFETIDARPRVSPVLWARIIKALEAGAQCTVAAARILDPDGDGLVEYASGCATLLWDINAAANKKGGRP